MSDRVFARSDDISWRFAFRLMLTVAIVAALAGVVVGEIRFTTGCRIGPDAPTFAYTGPVLRCDPPWWWER